jgi:hypothetical protein
MTKENLNTKIEFMIDTLARSNFRAPEAPLFPSFEGIGIMEFSLDQKKEQWREWLRDVSVDNSFEISHF